MVATGERKAEALEFLVQSNTLSRAEAEEKLEQLVGHETAANLRSAVWKERLTAMEMILAQLRALSLPELTSAASSLIQVPQHFLLLRWLSNSSFIQ